ncbi:MAG: riboflavin biosynthesis protein RibF [Oscillospiraceae bacterium]|nr:riboflavin biosynthesis protein RibF [Oscillospiraceae bacterium]
MATDKKRVIALGFFDGIHLGHAALLEKTKARASQLGATPSVLTFDTHPGQLVTGERVPLINAPAGRVDLIERLYGIRDVLILHFDEPFRRMSWMAFITALQEKFGAIHVVCGHNFHFGYGGAGTPDLLRARCAELGIGCDVIGEVSLDGQIVSSTHIRQLLLAGDMERANRLLGHPHTLVDTVRYGYKLGRTIGAPTINMTFSDGVLVPARGVYATRVYLEQPHIAVTNIGLRPTVGAADQMTVESYILDFSGNLYGRQVRVEFFHFIRPEIKFDGIEALKRQIQQDAEAARAYFM